MLIGEFKFTLMSEKIHTQEQIQELKNAFGTFTNGWNDLWPYNKRVPSSSTLGYGFNTVYAQVINIDTANQRQFSFSMNYVYSYQKPVQFISVVLEDDRLIANIDSGCANHAKKILNKMFAKKIVDQQGDLYNKEPNAEFVKARSKIAEAMQDAVSKITPEEYPEDRSYKKQANEIKLAPDGRVSCTEIDTLLGRYVCFRM